MMTEIYVVVPLISGKKNPWETVLSHEFVSVNFPCMKCHPFFCIDCWEEARPGRRSGGMEYQTSPAPFGAVILRCIYFSLEKKKANFNPLL